MGGTFVVHLHAATRTHHDLRLPIGGVLVSFAVPKGPSLDPAEKRFAARTEDHPIEYLDFEGVIPEGNYGAGPMIVWDRGRVRYLDGPAEEEIERGKLDFDLWGHKLKGRFALVRMKKSDKEWLFFKKADAFASTEGDIVAEKPRSVLSGLTTAELARRPELARSIEEEAAALGAPKRRLDARALAPMLCQQSGAPTSGEGWVYELKLDGMRAIASREGSDVAIKSRSGRDVTATYPEVARALRSIAAEQAVVDGEIVTFDESGQPSFQRLAQRIHLARAHEIRMAMAEVPVVYALFDLLAVGGYDLTPLPLAARKGLLARLLPAPGVLRVLDHIEGDGRALYAFCRERGLEGIVAKRASSPYRPGARSPDWVKMKCERDDEFVVVGFTRGEGARERLGALDIATYQGDRLIYRGKVGSGLDAQTIAWLLDRLRAIAVDAPTAEGEYASAPRGRTHVRPEIVLSVRYFGWSDDGFVWHPTFRGVRDDVAPKQCVASPKGSAIERVKEPSPPPPPVEPVKSKKKRVSGAEASAKIEGASFSLSTPAEDSRVAVTNASKVLWPEDGITKGELCHYYRAIAPVLLPYLRDRPVVMVRYPNGIDGKSFYQWNAPAGRPPWIRTHRMHGETGVEVDTLLIDNPDGLVYLANLACIPIHVLASRAGALDECDFLTIDFDPKSAPFSAVIDLALRLRVLLDGIGLAGFPKTSGQSGLHVLVPLGPGVSYATARMLADLLGHLLVQESPDTATMERTISKRGARVYVDTGQTGAVKTIAAPYSARAHRRATVSTPLRWDEVGASLDPSRLTIRSVLERVEALGDPMAPMLSARPDMVAAVGRLEARARASNVAPKPPAPKKKR